MTDSKHVGSRSDYLSRKIEKTEDSIEGVFLNPKSYRWGSDASFLKQIQNDIGTLDHLHAVSKMEPKFTELMDDVVHTAVTLSNYCQDVAPIDSVYSEIDTQKNLDKCWAYLTELSKAIQWHIHHSYKYHKFHHSVSNCNARIERFQETLAKHDNSILKSSEAGKNLQNDLYEIIDEINHLSSEVNQVAPLHRRRQMQSTRTYSAYLLTTLCLEDGTWLERGEVLEVTCVNCPNNMLKNEWHVKVDTKQGRTKAIRLPATCLWLIDADNWPSEEEVEKLANRDKDKPCVCDESLNNKLSVLALKKKLDNSLLRSFAVSNTRVRDAFRNSGSLSDSSGLDRLQSDYDDLRQRYPRIDFSLEDRQRAVQIQPIRDSISLSSELDNIKILLSDSNKVNTELVDIRNRDDVYSSNLKNDMNKFFSSFGENDKQPESLTCISNLHKPIERSNLYNTLSSKSKENSFRGRSGSMSQLIDSNAYGIQISPDIDRHFTGSCPCKYCGCERVNTNKNILTRSSNDDQLYKPSDFPTNELPIYNPEKYGTIPRYFGRTRSVENIYDQTISSIPRDTKSKKNTFKKGKRGNRFRKKSQPDESGVEFTPESEFEDYQLVTIPRQRRDYTYTKPEVNHEIITETLKPNARGQIGTLYDKTPGSRRSRPNFPYTINNQSESEIRDDIMSGRERSIDSITDTVVKSKVRPGRSKSTDPPMSDTRITEPRTMDSTIKSKSRERLSFNPYQNQPLRKPPTNIMNSMSSINDSVYPSTPDWQQDPYKKGGTIVSIRDNHSSFENPNEPDEELPFFSGDSFMKPSHFEERKRSLKSHRVQVGYPKVNSYPLKDAAVQIGQTSQMGYSEYDYRGTSDEENSRIINTRGKFVQNGLPMVGSSSYSTAFQIGPHMIDTGVDVQEDLPFTPKAESYGKKLQVGEPYWSGQEVKSDREYNWPREERIRSTNTMDSAHSPIKELLETKDYTKSSHFAPVMNSQGDNEGMETTREFNEDYSTGDYYKPDEERRTRYDQKYTTGHSTTLPRRRGHSAHSLCIHLHFDECLCCPSVRQEGVSYYDNLSGGYTREDLSQKIQIYHNSQHDCCCRGGGCQVNVDRLGRQLSGTMTKRCRSADEGPLRKLEGL